LNKQKKSLYILALGIFLSVAIRLAFVISGAEIADTLRMREVAEAVTRGINPYLLFNFYIYPPAWMFIEGLTLVLSNFLKLPFHMLIKFLPNLADIASCLLIYKFLARERVKPLSASFWSLAFILNPVSIIISSAHGQFDGVVSLLVLGAIYLITFCNERRLFVLSALVLGLAIAIKPNPVILLPLFLFYKKSGFRKKIVYLTLTVLPVSLTLIPFLFLNFRLTLSSVVGYSGVYDFGYAAILRGLAYQQNANYWLVQSPRLLAGSKLCFLAGSIFLFIIFAGAKNLAKSCLVFYLFFISVYFGISAQYLSWVIPLLVVTRSKSIILFTIESLLALMGFYLFFGPGILFGKLITITPYQSIYMPLYFVGNLALWLTTLGILIKGIAKEGFPLLKNFNPFRRFFAYAFLGLFIISLITVVKFL